VKYKKFNKAKLQKKTSLISIDHIKNNRFEEIIALLREKPELTRKDQYLYGYSLLRTKKYMDALIAFWPLAAKGHTKIQEDCTSIAAYVFKNEGLLSSLAYLSEDNLYILYQTAKNLFPKSQIYYHLRNHLFDALWQQRHYEKLERILKTSEDAFSSRLVENLSKLAFFQSEKKLLGNIPGFISHILTGAACFIQRNDIYHQDIAKSIRGLSSEIKCLFSNNRTWDKVLFANVLHYEATILTCVLELAVKTSGIRLDFIPTPGYLIHFDAAEKQTSQSFLTWLESENKELYEMYHPDTYYAVLWALNGETGMNTTAISKIQKNTFHPYLQLALKLRSTVSKKTIFKEDLEPKTFGNIVSCANHLFKNVLIQTAQTIAPSDSNAFWIALENFCSLLEEPVLNRIIIAKYLGELKKQLESLENLGIEPLKDFARRIKENDLENKAHLLYVRQLICSQFLSDIADQKKSKKIITNIKNELTLREQLTLMADSCTLLRGNLSLKPLLHMKSLFKNKRLNKFLPLKEYMTECICPDCIYRFYLHDMPRIAQTFALNTVCLSDLDKYVNEKFNSTEEQIFSSVLSTSDPFQTLSVALTDNKAAIMQKIMQLIKDSPNEMATFRQAQSELFDPPRRFLHHFLRYLSQMDDEEDFTSLPSSEDRLHNICLRQDFLNEHG